VGATPSIDRVVLVGDQSIEIVVPGGIHGDSATAAIVVNSVPGLLAARPGLRTMADMPPPRPWAAWG
jgi:4-hydroxy-tetrahydrodipicolinate reductase